MSPLKMYELDMAVLEYLKNHGRASRSELRLYIGGKDRQIRRSIERLRDLGYPIGMGVNGGYTFADKYGLRRIIAFYRKKAFKMLRTAARLAGIQLDGQMTMKEVFGDEVVF